MLVALVIGSGTAPLPAWDYEGHRVVNQLALASLPTNFPAFIFTAAARERIAFLSGEPDRWRNSPDLSFRHANAPDHFFDMDDLPELGMDWRALSPFRSEFTAHLAAARAARPDRFPPPDPARDADRTKALFGFLPWAITEHYAKLKSAFSYLQEFEAGGTPEEVANARENVIYVMGVMGHYVGDAAQPLHTTKHYNGWVGANPHRYTTNRTFHSWIDGGYFNKAGLNREALLKRVRPARLLASDASGGHTNLFPVVMRYLHEQFEKVETLYRLDRDHKLPGREGIHPEGYEFMANQILVGAQALGDLWLTAWRHAPPDLFLRSALARRKLGGEERRTGDRSGATTP